MNVLSFQFSATVQFSTPITDHCFILHCIPIECEVQKITRLDTTILPNVETALQIDGFGNTMLCGTLYAPHSHFHYRTEGIVHVDLSKSSSTYVHPMYRYPSHLTQPNDAMRTLAHTLSPAPPMQQLEILSALVQKHLHYCTGVTHTNTTAAQALAVGAGVCQDYTHVFLTLARLCGFPARYCMGLTLGEGATHAWPEIALPSGWYGIDPTRNCMVDETYICFAVGRDAADCPAERGVFRGNSCQTQQIIMSVTKQ